jgi:plastocyanin
MYLAIVGFAIFFVIQNQPAGGETAPTPPEGGGGGGGVVISAQNVAFDTETLTLPADEETPIEFNNDDASSVQHNVAIYDDDSAEKSLFQGEVIPGGQSITYDVPPLKKGSYYFQCDVHPGMNGDVEVE